MASATRGESSNPYGGGFTGKFRKSTARKSHKTPYDRPPTSVRLGGGENRGRGGWLSKLVDPAQRLITYSAHKLFASVFRKRLGSGESPLQSPEKHQQQQQQLDVIQETKVGQRENTSGVNLPMPIRVEDTNASVDLTKDGFTDLEKILKEKTFTRSEVDRLTTLLRAKAGDSSTVNVEKRNEVGTVTQPPSNEMERTHQSNGLVSTPLRSARAIDECGSSPAQLAKAYMGSRPSEVTPSMLGLRGQSVREDSVFLNKTPFVSKSPIMSLVPRPSGQRPMENGFATPRSRGRSAVYNMARTPYSRPQSTVKIGSLLQASPSTLDRTFSSGSRLGSQSGVKRRSSVLDNDIGSVGPIRRIRQKSNISSRSLALPASDSPLSVRGSVGQNVTHATKDGAEAIPGSSYNLVPSKSSEVASKILQQLDKLVSTKEKSPSKLSPSMLHGPALKSLQKVESPKFSDHLPNKKKEDSPGSSHRIQEKSIGSSSKEVLTLSEKKTNAAVDDTRKIASRKDKGILVEGTSLPFSSSLREEPPKKRAFRMIADEDLVELDDDNGTSSTPSELSEKQNPFKSVAIVTPEVEKPLTTSVNIPSTSYIPNGVASQGTSNGSLENGKSKFPAFSFDTVQPSDKASEPTSISEKSSVSPVKANSEEKVISQLEPPKKAPVFPNIFSSTAATDLPNQNAGPSANIKLEKPSSSSFVVSEKPTESRKRVSYSAFGEESTLNGSIFPNGANAASNGSSPSSPSIPSINPVNEVSGTVQSPVTTPATSSLFAQLPANNNSNDITSSNPAPTLSSTSIFKFGEPPAPFIASTLSASGSQFSKETEVKKSTFGDINSFKFSGEPAQVKSASALCSGPSSSSTLNPFAAVASSAPVSSESSIAGVTSSSTPSTETSKSLAATTTGSNPFSTSFPNFSSSMSGSVAASTPSSPFGFIAASSSAAADSSQSQASNIFATANGGSGSSSLTQSVPFQFNSSASAPSPFGVIKSEPLVSASSSAMSSSPFGKSWQTQSPSFTSSFTTSSPSATLNFGSSAAAATSSTTPAPFFGSSSFNFVGSSAATVSSTPASVFSASTTTNAPSSSGIFNFNSTAPSSIPQQSVFSNSAATPSPSVFANSTPGFPFPPAYNTNGFSSNNQQTSMEDSMAEDTTTSMVQQQSMFGQPPSTPQQGGFAPSMANPFQFGGQPPPQNNASPFQSTQSVEFQGGSFSLGSTGGGDKSGRRVVRVKKTNRKK